jgi:hypothetical protein
MVRSYIKVFWIANMLILVGVANGFLFAQHDQSIKSDYSIIIVNKKGETFKNIETGDFCRVNLKNGSHLKGRITSINSEIFTVDSTTVYIEQVRSISTKKVKTQVIAGSVLLGGAVASLAHSAATMELSLFGGTTDNSESESFGFLGFACLAGSTAAFLPNYHKIGDKYKIYSIASPVKVTGNVAIK